MRNILFVCSRNKWRSLTAETIYKKDPYLNVKSAGTENAARIKINAQLIAWADLIFVMEKHHLEKIISKYPVETKNSEIIILDIPDLYKFMNKELIAEIKLAVSPYLY